MKNEGNQERSCPCGTGKAYGVCCKPFHQGLLPDSALKLMRSRYSAYALCLPEYIIATTHPTNPQFCHDATQWSQSLAEFCSYTEFNKLEILDFQQKDHFAIVTFVAYLSQNKKNVSFKEKSYFEKVEGKWLYRRGKVEAMPS